MNDAQWCRIRPGLSWHIFRNYTRVPGQGVMVCGRRVSTTAMVDDRPGNDKTCETCLRIAGPR